MAVPVLQYYAHELVSGAILSILGAAAMYPIKLIRKAYKEVTENLEAVQKELTVQRENCLTTLQRQGDSQIELLKEVSSTLKEIHLDQSRLLGRLER